MIVAVFNTKAYDRRFLQDANRDQRHQLLFHEPRLNRNTAALASGADAVCVFVNDVLDRATLEALARIGISAVALRCAGFNNVDLAAAEDLGLQVVRVPAYSPYAVAEHTVALILTLNRKTHRAHNRVHEGNFSLEGLLGFDLHGKVVGVIGTGKIGAIFSRIMTGFGCRVLAFDPLVNPDCLAIGVDYVAMEQLLSEADIVSLHCPLTPASRHLIDDRAIASMRQGCMLINTSRGGLIDAPALIRGLKSGKVGYVGLDVYEEEADLFFEDLSNTVIQDDVFARLTTFTNVLITGHQGFFTDSALENIATTTLANLTDLEIRGCCDNAVTTDLVRNR